MRAIVQEGYGSPDVLRLREIELPAVADDGVLVRVHAASVNAFDAHLVYAPPVARPFFGLRRPRIAVRGVDVAGTVESVGRNVTRFKPGDEVFGAAPGAFAEYATAREARLALGNWKSSVRSVRTEFSTTVGRTSRGRRSASTCSSTLPGRVRSAIASGSSSRRERSWWRAVASTA